MRAHRSRWRRAPVSGSEGDRLRGQIRDLTAQYYRAVWGDAPAFVPGETRVPYGGRVFDDGELDAAVDASLDFWLTYGRYSERFERELGEYLGVAHCLLVNSGSSANLLAFMALTSEQLGERRVSPRRRGDHGRGGVSDHRGADRPVRRRAGLRRRPRRHGKRGRRIVSRRPWVRARKAVFLAHTLGQPLRRGCRAELLRAARPLADRGQLRRARFPVLRDASPAASVTWPRRASIRRTT